MVTRYERIERMVPHRAEMFIVVDASKIKTIESSFGDRPKMKRLLRESNDRGYKIVPVQQDHIFRPAPVAALGNRLWVNRNGGSVRSAFAMITITATSRAVRRTAPAQLPHHSRVG
jgi:hypothetical protein